MIRVAVIVLTVCCLLAPRAEATPHYAIEAASRCNSCHVEPIGWANPDRSSRRCTLDCLGCHISPSGGGMRTPLGRYYGENELPAWGRRPESAADPERFLQPGYPDEGTFQLLRGFEGWWPGSTEFREIPDRYGSIEPSPVWQAGGDFRSMVVIPTDTLDRDVVAFPMELQAYLALHPASGVTVYGDIGYQGSVAAGPVGPDAPARDPLDVLWLRELFVMRHDMTWGSYVRAGRFSLPFGWRIPDHTAYTRQGSFDQSRQGYGVEAGLGANEGWGNLALWGQGLTSWPGDNLDSGFGVSGTGGLRLLGGQVGLSGHLMRGTGGNGDEIMLGPMWGLNLSPLSYLGEFDWRRLDSPDGRPRDELAQLHEVRWTAYRGFAPKVRWEWTDRDVLYRDDHRNRIVVGWEFNPVRYLQIDTVFRQSWIRARTDEREFLVQLHVWAL